PFQEGDAREVSRVRAEHRNQPEDDKEHDAQAWSPRADVFFHRRRAARRGRVGCHGHGLLTVNGGAMSLINCNRPGHRHESDWGKRSIKRGERRGCGAGLRAPDPKTECWSVVNPAICFAPGCQTGRIALSSLEMIAQVY